jgi:hypothetical protein
MAIMNWITKRYDQFFLAVTATGLVVCAAMIIVKAQSFRTILAIPAFSPSVSFPDQGPEAPISAAREKLQNPPLWQPTPENPTGPSERGSLFVPAHYLLVNASSPPQRIYEAPSLYHDSLTGKPIPNVWFVTHGLPLLDPSVARQDPDKDGFRNEDEWRWNTNPNDRESHPPYYSKLFLGQFISVPFRWILKAYDGDPQVDPLERITFQIEALDLHHPSAFVKIGQMVPDTSYKVQDFRFKQAFNTKIGMNQDVSELTLVHVQNGHQIVLVYNQIVDSPDSFAEFTYDWPVPPQTFRVKKGQQFALRPEIDQHYTLLDVNATEAHIRLPSGEIQTIPHR